jgi:acyl phosphate:glycerol-3-phosphate acyltransferase
MPAVVSIGLPILVTLALTYLLGSIPFGFLAAKWLKGIDLREIGSGSTGATNVLRTLGKKAGITVLLLDVLKGATAIFAMYGLYLWFGQNTCALDDAQREIIAAIAAAKEPVTAKLSGIFQDCLNLALAKPWLIIAAGTAAILGHSKSVWLGWRGGKSVATGLGVLIAMDYRVALTTSTVFLLSALVTRIVSISSILAVFVTTIAFLYFQPVTAYLLFAAIGSLYVIWLHRTNIQRLLNGTEPKIGQKAPEKASIDR